jgi:hypothetical protein
MPILPEMDDERLDFLIQHLERHHPGGFVNHVVMRDELLDTLKEVRSARERPLHCPCCDGDHP